MVSQRNRTNTSPPRAAAVRSHPGLLSRASPCRASPPTAPAPGQLVDVATLAIRRPALDTPTPRAATFAAGPVTALPRRSTCRSTARPRPRRRRAAPRPARRRRPCAAPSPAARRWPAWCRAPTGRRPLPGRGRCAATRSRPTTSAPASTAATRARTTATTSISPPPLRLRAVGSPAASAASAPALAPASAPASGAPVSPGGAGAGGQRRCSVPSRPWGDGS